MSEPAVDHSEAAHSINQRIFETSLDLILVVDRKGNFIRVSPSSATILGCHPDEMVGHSAAEFLYPEDLESTRNELRMARRGRLTRNFDTRYVHKDGHAVALAWTGVWSEPEQQHFFIGRDMTERIAAEERLRHAQRLEAIGELTGGIAHDFNNLLGIIIGRELGFGDVVESVNFGERPAMPPPTQGAGPLNRRAEMWMEMRDWLKDGPVQIPDSDTLHADLCGPTYSYDSNQRLERFPIR